MPAGRGSNKRGSTKKGASKKGKAGKGSTAKGKGQQATPVLGGVLVSIVPNPAGGETFQLQGLEGTTPREMPTLLRQAAAEAEKQLTGG